MSENNTMEISVADLNLTETELTLNEKQLSVLFKKTPAKHVYQRPAKGGGSWNYVTGTYVKKVLNLLFNFDWDFEIVEHKYDLDIKQAFVLGKLTVRTNGKTIVKMQFGTKDIMFKKATGLPMDLGNDLKAATTNALKKCASELGIASDVYAPNEFKEIKVVSTESKEDKAKNELLNRIKKHIYISNTLDQLLQVEVEVAQFQDIELTKLYQDKFNTL